LPLDEKYVMFVSFLDEEVCTTVVMIVPSAITAPTSQQ